MELSILAVILGFILDLIVGDPHWLYHPIRLVGHLISGLEKILRKVFPKTKRGELTAGVFLLILTSVSLPTTMDTAYLAFFRSPSFSAS